MFRVYSLKNLGSNMISERTRPEREIKFRWWVQNQVPIENNRVMLKLESSAPPSALKVCSFESEQITTNHLKVGSDGNLFAKEETIYKNFNKGN